MGSDTISRQIVSELSYVVGHPAGVGEFLGVGVQRTHTSGVRSVASVVRVKERHTGKVSFSINALLLMENLRKPQRARS